MTKQRPKKMKSTRGAQPFPDIIFHDPSDPDLILFRDNRFPDKVYHYSSFLHGETSEWVKGEDLKVSKQSPEEDWRAEMRKEYEEVLERRNKQMEDEKRKWEEEMGNMARQRVEMERMLAEKIEAEEMEMEKAKEDELKQERLVQKRLEQERLEQNSREQATREPEAALTELPSQDTTTGHKSAYVPSPKNAWLEHAKAVASGLLNGITTINDLLLLPNATDDEAIDNTFTLNSPLQKDQTLISDLPIQHCPKPIDNLPKQSTSAPNPPSALAASLPDSAFDLPFAPKEPHFRVPYARSTCESTLFTTHHHYQSTILSAPSPHLPLTPELSICWFLLFLFLFPRALIPLPLRHYSLQKLAISPHNQKSWHYLQSFLRATMVVWLVHVGWVCFLEWLKDEEEVVIGWDDDAPRVWYCGCESWPVFKPLEALGWCERRA